MAREEKVARLVAREELTPTLGIFRFELEGGVPAFEPGQYLTLGLPGEGDEPVVWRAYSIASPPEETRWVELYVRWMVHPVEGALTTRLGKLRVGDEARWLRPKGRFTIEAARPDGSPDTRRLVLIAAGTGVAPFVSYARHLHAAGSTRELLVCHGASYPDELGYRGLFEELQAASAPEDEAGWHLCYLPTVSRPLEDLSAEWRGETGRVHELLQRPGDGRPCALERALGDRLSPRTSFVHVCGFEGTVRDVLAALEPLDFRDPRHPREDGGYDLKWESFG
jgi:ferredoxin--NADP+ reductase